jgi:hypothetical protein
MDNLTDEMRIANCKCCLLAPAMRDCKNCTFNIGLVYKALENVKQNEVIDNPGLSLLAIRRTEFIQPTV